MGKACLTDKIDDDKILFNWVALEILLCMLVHFDGQVDLGNRAKDVVKLSFSHFDIYLIFNVSYDKSLLHCFLHLVFH